jgi:hypothetical protein
MASISERIGAKDIFHSYAEATFGFVLVFLTPILATIINDIDAQLTAPTVIVGEAFAVGSLIASGIKTIRNSRQTQA